MVSQTLPSQERDPMGQPQKAAPLREPKIQESFEEVREKREELSLVLTELDVRVVSPSEAQDLSRTMGGPLRTLTLPLKDRKAEEILDVSLSDSPILVLFREAVTVREAYSQLHSLLETPRPEPKPRAGSCPSSPSCGSSPPYLRLPPDQQHSLWEVVRTGMDTGGRTLILSHSSVALETLIDKSQQSPATTPLRSNKSTCTVAGLVREGQRVQARGEDIRSSTYRRLDSLEETIRELEITLLEISSHPSSQLLRPLHPSSDAPQGEDSAPGWTPSTPASESRKPPVPPKPASFAQDTAKVQNLLLCFEVWSLLDGTHALSLSPPSSGFLSGILLPAAFSSLTISRVLL